MKRKLQEVAAIIQQDPAVSTVTGSVGGGGFGPGGGGASANLTIALKPLSRTAHLGRQVIARLRPKLDRWQASRLPAGGAGHRRRRRPFGQLAVSIHAARR